MYLVQLLLMGLEQPPSFTIIKNREQASTAWRIDHFQTGAELYFDTGANQAVYWNNQVNSSVITFNKSDSTYQNLSGKDYIAYCFRSVEGYSKISSYLGNGNADGTFAYTGFRPAFVLLKALTGTNNWSMYDNKRDTDNPVRDYLIPNNSAASAATDTMDFS